jgi:hypothetical protein
VALHDPLWLTACCLNSFVKFNILRTHEQDKPKDVGVEVLQCKALALKHIQKTIQTAKANLDDLTILSAIFLMTFEVWTGPEQTLQLRC